MSFLYRLFLCALLSLCALPSFAQSRGKDSWTGKDKAGHFLAGALITGSVQVATGDTALAVEVGTIAALGKEFTDMHRTGHVASFRDATATLVGVLVSAQIAGLTVTPVSVSYVKTW